MKSKSELAIKLFCVMILTALCIAIYINGKDLSCDACIVRFTSEKTIDPLGTTKEPINVSIMELYESYLNDDCIITFDKSQGFIKKGSHKPDWAN